MKILFFAILFGMIMGLGLVGMSFVYATPDQEITRPAIAASDIPSTDQEISNFLQLLSNKHDVEITRENIFDYDWTGFDIKLMLTTDSNGKDIPYFYKSIPYDELYCDNPNLSLEHDIYGNKCGLSDPSIKDSYGVELGYALLLVPVTIVSILLVFTILRK